MDTNVGEKSGEPKSKKLRRAAGNTAVAGGAITLNLLVQNDRTGGGSGELVVSMGVTMAVAAGSLAAASGVAKLNERRKKN